MSSDQSARLNDLEAKFAFQDDHIRKLDEALQEQQKQLDLMNTRLGSLLQQLKSVESGIPEGEEPPPPHY